MMQGMTYGITIVLVCCLSHCFAETVKGHCRHPLGVQDKRIPDSSMRATSFHSLGTSPKYARLRLDEGDGAWCPKGFLKQDTEDEYLEVDLPQRSFVSVVATQGRYSRGRGVEFVRMYKLNYTRNGESWDQWKNFRGNDILSGNVDAIEVKNQLLNPSIQGATGIRFIPVTKRDMVACMRVEIYGCPSLSDLVSYEMTKPGDIRMNPDGTTVINNAYSFDDDRYDGFKTTTMYSGGLGQLTDGIIGSNQLEEMKSALPTRQLGYDYVGWKNNNKNNRFVTITFNFANVYNFTKMLIHTFSSEAIDAEHFSSVELSFRVDGLSSKFNSRTTYEVPLSSSETSVISVPLGSNFAKTIKACFKMRGVWMLISEIEFTTANYEASDTEMIGSGFSRIADNGELVTLQNPVRTKDHINTIALIVGTLVAVISILLLVVLILAYRQRKLRKTMIPTRLLYRGGSSSLTGSPSVTVCIPQQTVTLTPTSCVVNGIQNCKNEDAIYHEIHGNCSRENDYLEPKDVIKPSTLPKRNSNMTTSKASASCSSSSTIPYYAETNLRGMEVPTDIGSIQGMTGSSLYAVPQNLFSPTPAPRSNKKCSDNASETSTLLADNLDDVFINQTIFSDDFVPIEISCESLKVIDKLGEGQFGEVQLCEANPSLRTVAKNHGMTLKGNDNSKVILAVKVLRKGAFPDAKEGFLKEIKILSQLRHPNIVRVVAVCSQNEPYVMAMEYMEHGDLHQYLQGFEMCTHREDDSQHNESTTPEIRYHELLLIATQIASGMQYLSSLNLVHRDLAARNCLVGPGNSIQIADFGMSRNMYQSEYYRIQGKAILPIRWMSWECVLMGKFSAASDVWAFGVTLWEIFTLCKCQPYQSMDDNQVVENMHHVYQKDGEEVHLPKPKFCPAGVFKMVHQCWTREPEERPKFHQLHKFIQDRIPSNNNDSIMSE